MRISIGMACMMMIAVLIPMVGAADLSMAYDGLPTRSTITVGTDGMYDTIQEAVDNATSGDWIHIYSGVYNESVYVNKSLTFEGNGSSETILNGSQSGDGYVMCLNGTGISGDRFIIDSIGFENGKSNTSFGIVAVDVERLDINNSKFAGFSSNQLDSENSAIRISNSTNVLIFNCNIVMGSNAHGIFISESDNVLIDDCDIFSDRSGILMSFSNSSEIRYSTIWSGNGITLIDGCNNVKVYDNYIRAIYGLQYPWSDFTGWGIGLFNNCDGNEIYLNEIVKTLRGISINNGSDNNEIMVNNVWFNEVGIVFNDYYYMNDPNICSSNLVENSTISYNDYCIIANGTEELEVDRCNIVNGEMGMTGWYSTSFYLHNSTIRYQTLGMSMSNSSWGSVKYNLFQQCTDFAIVVNWDKAPVEHMRIHGNAFVLNGGSGATYDPDHKQATAGEGIYCQFDDGNSTGNYWSDWTTPDNDSDGVVDKPYHVGWKDSEDVVDNYPMTEFPLSIMIGPIITTKSLPPAYINRTYSYELGVVDPDTDREDMDWILHTNASWLSITDSGVLSGKPGPSDIGPYWVHINVSDYIFSSGADFTLEVLFNNTAPVITTTNVLTATEEVLYSVDYDAVDDDPLTWELWVHPDWLTINATTGVLSGTPEYGGFTYRVKVVVSDGYLTNSTEFNITVSNVNDAPEIGLDPSNPPIYDPELKKYVRKKIDLYAVEDSFMSYHFNAYDEDGDKMIWTISRGPSFMSMTSYFFPGSGQSDMYLNGTPDNDDVGTHVVTINVTDGNGGMAFTTFNLTINNTNDAPAITTTDVTTATENTSYSVDYDAKDMDPTNDTLSWSLNSNASFLSISSSTGVLSGTPGQTDSGTYWVNVSVSDGKGGVDSTNFTLTVSAVNLPPFIGNEMADVTVDEDSDETEIDLKEIFSDPDGDDIYFTSESPEGVNVYIDENWIAWIVPDPNWAGEGIITIYATDGEETTSISFKITVRNVNDAPTSAGITLGSASFVEGDDQIVFGTSVDPDLIYGDIMNYSWYIDGELVGYGENIDLDLPAGEYTLLLRVTDSGGEIIEETVNIIVEEGPDPGTADDLFDYIAVIIGLVLAVVIIVSLLVYRRRERSQEDRMMDPGRGGSVPPSSMPDPHGMGPGMEIPVPINVGEIPSMDDGLISGRLDDDDLSGDEYPVDDIIDEIYLQASSADSYDGERMRTSEIMEELDERMRNGEISQDLYGELYKTIQEEE